MKKKVLAVILAAALALTMAGCGGSGSTKGAAEEKEAEEITLDLTDDTHEEELPEEGPSAQKTSEEMPSEEEKEDTGEAAAEDAVDVTELLGTDELEQYKGQKVVFRGMKSVDIEDAGGDLIRFLYNSEGTGDTGDDLYFCMEKNDETYSFIVKAGQCGPETEVYQAVETMEEDAVVDMEGYVEFIEYKGANPDIIAAITGVTPAK